MSVPKRKLSKRRKRLRATHHSIAGPSVRPCSTCKHPGPSHCVCENCGHYGDREIFAKDAD